MKQWLIIRKGSKIVVTKAKGRISKRMLQEKQSTPNFQKNEHFLPPDTHMRIRR